MAKSSFYSSTNGTSTSVSYSYAGGNPVPLSNDGEIVIVIDGAGVVPSTGVKADIPIMFACQINSAVLVADQAGSAVVDVLSAPVGTTPVASICGAAQPTLASASSKIDTTLTGWTTTVAASTTLRIQLNSISTITRLTVVLKITKTT